jgi:sigma54-dependent transcription regulator
MSLLPLEQVNASVGPLAYLDLFERVNLETVSRACREEVRAPALWGNQLFISASSKEGRLVNDVL